MKIWQKSNHTEIGWVDRFTAGQDRLFDALLAPFDVTGTLAHGEMLFRCGLLSESDWNLIKPALEQIRQEVSVEGFVLPDDAEDIHSYVEFLLVSRIGEAGKKIHTARSRNDQVLLDLKLYMRAQLQVTRTKILELFELLMKLAENHSNELLPGYTHFQLAMPSSFGLWFSAYAEALADDMDLWKAAWNICDRNPLGSGAGFGSSFPIDRMITTKLLGMNDIHINSVYAQMSRGKSEKWVAQALAGFGSTIARFANEVIIYLNQHFDFISFPENLTTGSSIMPHKKNPDVFELIRARCNALQSLPFSLTLISTNLPSGYQRDFQLTKEYIFPAFETLNSCIDALCEMLSHIKVKENILESHPQYTYLYTVDYIHQLVKDGKSFREAYVITGDQVSGNSFVFNGKPEYTHLGSIGNPGFAEIRAKMNRFKESVESQKD